MFPSLQQDKFQVLVTQDLTRISQLRRRVWTPEAGEELAESMTSILRTPNGQMKLRPVQAIALFELATEGGLFAPIRVGGGKSLISLLAPIVLQRIKRVGYRPLLIIPASLVEKTERDRRQLSEHWQLPTFIRTMSYEYLGRINAAEALDEFKPDFLFLDEAHRARNLKAAVTRRLRRHLNDNPHVVTAATSGTVTKRSIHDYAHIIRWCLPPAETPLPLHYNDLENWALALDERKSGHSIGPGALRALCNEEENILWEVDAKNAARSAFRRRLIETPGVVATSESPIDASLIIRGVSPYVSEEIEEAFKVLREDWLTPDDWPIADGLTNARHARELSFGFFYKWDPRPPDDWLAARKVWCKFVRETLKYSRRLDSEAQVRSWAATLPECKELQAWEAVKDTFEPNTVPVWLDDSVLNFVSHWAASNKGIIWCQHKTVGHRLEQDYGIPYYGKKGLDSRGNFIDDHPGNAPLAASISSNRDGRNLQKWNRNLVLGMPANGLAVEQLLGRTHRDGQLADEVYVEVVVSCYEHFEAFEQAQRDSRYVASSTGAPQKLLDATVDMEPTNLLGLGPRWKNNKQEKSNGNVSI